MPLTPQQAIVLRLHRELEESFNNGSERFISGYETINPFAGRYMNGSGHASVFECELGAYSFAQDQSDLIRAIRAFHRQADGIDYSPEEILVSAGSSPLILVLMTYLRSRRAQPIHYFHSLYHTFYFFADLLDLCLLPLGSEPLWTPGALPSLPPGQKTLLFADPVWFAGRALGAMAIEEIGAWQRRTGSLVIVDGTFQYLKWSWPPERERSTTLDRGLTIRLICPTKSVAVHGIRFAYLLSPARILRELRWVSQNVTGSSSRFDLHAAMRIMEVLSGPESNRDLVSYIRERYRKLAEEGFVNGPGIEPECSYYVFGRLAKPEPAGLFMGGAHFDLENQDDSVRVNLLSPYIES